MGVPAPRPPHRAPTLRTSASSPSDDPSNTRSDRRARRPGARRAGGGCGSTAAGTARPWSSSTSMTPGRSRSPATPALPRAAPRSTMRTSRPREGSWRSSMSGVRGDRSPVSGPVHRARRAAPAGRRGIERRWRLSPGAASSARLLKRGRSYRPGAGGPGLGRVSSRSSSSTSEAARTPHGRGSSRGGAPGRAAAARASSGRLTPPPAPRRIGWHGIRSPATLTSCWLSSAERSIGACATTRPGPRSTDDLTVTAAAPRARLVPARPRPPGEPRPSTAPRRPRPVDRARAPSPDGGGSPWSVPCRRWSAGWGFRRGWGSAPFRRGARVGSAAS